MWRELIESLTDNCRFTAPATQDEILTAERNVGIVLPSELKELLEESNGVSAEYGLDLIWPVDRISRDNLLFREKPDFKELYMPFEPLLFFADTGDGDQFAFTILDGIIRRPEIFVWNHEDDSRTFLASSLREYLEWATGTLKI